MSLTAIPSNRILERVQLPASIIERLMGQIATVTTFDQIHEAQLALSHGDLDAILTSDSSGKPSIQLEGSDPAVNKMVLLLLQRVMSANAASIQPNVTVFARKRRYGLLRLIRPGSDRLLFVLLRLHAGRRLFPAERTSGTLETSLATPIRRSEIVLGYLLGLDCLRCCKPHLLPGSRSTCSDSTWTAPSGSYCS